MRSITVIITIFISLFLITVLVGTAKQKDREEDMGTDKNSEDGGDYNLEQDEQKHYPVPPPPFSEGIFPCSRCHKNLPVNREERELKKEHTEIKLNHMPEGWCFTCHDAENRDKLRLSDDRLIDYDESYYICAQCHEDKFRDWKAGVHGRVTGEWNGEKEYLLCANCHWPHDPKFKPLSPEPPPVRPEEIKLNDD